MRSSAVRLATTLVWLGVLPAVGCLYLSALTFMKTDDLLLFVMPLVASFLLCAGLFLLSAVVSLGVRLGRGHPGARLQTALLGGLLAVMGCLALAAAPGLGFLLLLYGGALLYLMTTVGAAADLGPWRRAVQQPAPWGARPGRGIWAPAGPQPGLHPSVQPGPEQGPWAPDPTTLPWFSWKRHSGPRAPWWQTWQAGLAQGIPLWELIVLVVALAAFVAGLGSVLVPSLRPVALMLVPVPIAVVAVMEQRMRARLAGRR